VLKEALGDLPVLAEDLGEITPDVYALRDQFDLPGMKILQFGFDGDANHPFLPDNYPVNCVAYTGTHDNDTVVGWYQKTKEEYRDYARRYLSVDGSDIAWDMIRAIWASRARMVLAPMQDILSLDNQARMNTPGIIGGNWAWRVKAEDINGALTEKLLKLNQDCARNQA
jgi:4-alpha-glucanotransferase